MAINFDEELIRVEFVIGEDTMSETVSGEVQVENGKPDIERIIDVKANLNNVTANIEEGGVDVSGVIEVGIVYVASTPEGTQPVHFTHGTLSFENFFDFPEAENGMNVFADVTIRRVSFTQIEEEPPTPPEITGIRTVQVDVVIQKFVKVTEYQQITVITGVTGIPEENITEELLRIEDVIGENTVTSVITGEISPEPPKPPIERVLNVTVEIVDKEVEITQEGVIVDGKIEAGVIYVAETAAEDQPVHFFHGDINFTETIDVPGAEEGMNAHVDLTVKKVTYDYNIGDESVEVDVVVQFFVKVTEPKQVNVITDIISDQIEIERELLRVEDVIGEDVVHETVSDTLSVLPFGKPFIERIIEPTARVVDYEATAEDGGVYLEGDIEATATYVAATPEGDQPVHFVDTPQGSYFNFDNFIDIPGTEPGMNVHHEVEVVKVSAEPDNLQQIPEAEEGEEAYTEIDFDIVIRKFAKVTEFRQLDIVTGIIVISPVADECPPSYIVYVVQPGDTLWKISRRYQTTVDALIRANPSIDPNNLQVGQKICVPRDIIKPKG